MNVLLLQNLDAYCLLIHSLLSESQKQRFVHGFEMLFQKFS